LDDTNYLSTFKNICISGLGHKKARDKKKIWCTIEWGREPGQRTATGIFTYTRPLDALQKNHNKESLAILET
jgi:hypothetical protein